MAGTRFGVESLDEGWADRLVERLMELRHLGQYGSLELARPVARALVERLAPQSRLLVPEHRRKGYGEAIMVAAAEWAEERGAIALGRNVFGHNAGARALYDRLGFVVTEENHRMALP